jgi:PEP-CTERM motif
MTDAFKHSIGTAVSWPPFNRMEELMFKRRFMHSAVLAMAILGVALIATATPARADTFFLTSCHITGSSCDGGNVSEADAFGTVTLTASGTSVNVDVLLSNGNKFVETGAGANELFLFNATVGNTVTNLSATFNGADVTATLGGLTYTFHAPPGVHADGTGNFTGSIECTVAANCNGNSIVTTVNDLHFTVTNATLAQLETANNAGNLFAADILCGNDQPSCPGGLTGPVDVSTPGVVPEPTTLLMVGTALAGLGAAWRRRRSTQAAV